MLNKKVILFHGFGSDTNDNRERILKKYGVDLLQEQHDYLGEWNKDEGESFFKKQLEKSKDMDLIIGVSFGGYIAYHIGMALNKPVMLINPALDRSKSKSVIREYKMEYNAHNVPIELIQGKLDTSVPPKYAIDYLVSKKQDFRLIELDKMAHRVPDKFFIKILNQTQFLSKVK